MAAARGQVYRWAMTTSDAHRPYDELDDLHTMAGDGACACENLHLDPESEAHAEHVKECGTTGLSHLEVPENAQHVGEDIHLHFH